LKRTFRLITFLALVAVAALGLFLAVAPLGPSDLVRLLGPP
jgi:hypothetical protein